MKGLHYREGVDINVACINSIKLNWPGLIINQRQPTTHLKKKVTLYANELLNNEFGHMHACW